MNDLEKNLREEVRKFLETELNRRIFEMTESLHGLSRQSFLKGVELGSTYIKKEENHASFEAYEVSNKVFKIMFRHKSDAEKFVSQYSPTSGLQITPTTILGTGVEWRPIDG